MTPLRLTQLLTGVAMVLFLGSGFIPAARRHATATRAVILAVYLAACAVLLGWIAFGGAR
jgi:hypothetical protein